MQQPASIEDKMIGSSGAIASQAYMSAADCQGMFYNHVYMYKHPQIS